MRDETVHSPVYCVGGAPVSYHRRRSGLRTQTGRYQLSPSTAEMTESFSVSASPARFNCHAQPLACTSPAVATRSPQAGKREPLGVGTLRRWVRGHWGAASGSLCQVTGFQVSRLPAAADPTAAPLPTSAFAHDPTDRSSRAPNWGVSPG